MVVRAVIAKESQRTCSVYAEYKAAVAALLLPIM